jgi:hypothetical protein
VLNNSDFSNPGLQTADYLRTPAHVDA